MADELSAWFLSQRGITRETLGLFGVGVKPNGDVTFPYPNGEKVRPNPLVPLRPEQRRFIFTKGKVPDLYAPTVQSQGTVAFLCEGETDTMRMYQELGGTYPVYGIGGINTWHEGLARNLSQYERVHVVLDNDSDYMVQAQVDNAWRKIRHDLGGSAKRMYLPQDVKDVCEFFDRYDAETLSLMAQRSTASQFKTVDFTVSPPPVSWLLEGLVAKGDVTVLAGKGGLGKSWITMALTMAMLKGDPDLLERPVMDHGRVLYIDQENPLDVVHDRMKRMGLNPADHAGSLRYIWNQGIKLDRDPDKLLDEALSFKPSLVVLDSLTRLHSREENVAGEIAPLFNDGIQPLARETGAAVILIHHHDKSASGPRGSTDIVNSADAVIDIYDRGAINPGKFLLRVNKTRRRLGGQEEFVEIKDMPDGTVVLEANAIMNDPNF